MGFANMYVKNSNEKAMDNFPTTQWKSNGQKMNVSVRQAARENMPAIVDAWGEDIAKGTAHQILVNSGKLVRNYTNIVLLNYKGKCFNFSGVKFPPSTYFSEFHFRAGSTSSSQLWLELHLCLLPLQDIATIQRKSCSSLQIWTPYPFRFLQLMTAVI